MFDDGCWQRSDAHITGDYKLYGLDERLIKEADDHMHILYYGTSSIVENITTSHVTEKQDCAPFIALNVILLMECFPLPFLLLSSSQKQKGRRERRRMGEWR